MITVTAICQIVNPSVGYYSLSTFMWRKAAVESGWQVAGRWLALSKRSSSSWAKRNLVITPANLVVGVIACSRQLQFSAERLFKE